MSLLNLLIQYWFCCLCSGFWPRGGWGLSSQTRGQTHSPCIGRWRPWTSREASADRAALPWPTWPSPVAAVSGLSGSSRSESPSGAHTHSMQYDPASEWLKPKWSYISLLQVFVCGKSRAGPGRLEWHLHPVLPAPSWDVAFILMIQSDRSGANHYVPIPSRGRRQVR